MCDQEIVHLDAGRYRQLQAGPGRRRADRAGTDIERRRVDDVRRRKLGVVERELEEPAALSAVQVPAEVAGRAGMTVRIEPRRRREHEVTEEAVPGEEADRAVTPDA